MTCFMAMLDMTKRGRALDEQVPPGFTHHRFIVWDGDGYVAEIVEFWKADLSDARRKAQRKLRDLKRRFSSPIWGSCAIRIESWGQLEKDAS